MANRMPGMQGVGELLRVAQILACEGYWKDISHVQLACKVLRDDEVLWGVVKDEVCRGSVSRRTRLMYVAFVGDMDRVRFLLGRGAQV